MFYIKYTSVELCSMKGFYMKTTAYCPNDCYQRVSIITLPKSAPDEVKGIVSKYDRYIYTNPHAPNKEESRILNIMNKGCSLSTVRMNAAEELAARGYNPSQYGLCTRKDIEVLGTKLQSYIKELLKK